MTQIPLTDTSVEIHVSQPLTTAGMLTRAILCGLRRPSGHLDSAKPSRRIIVRQDRVKLETERIELFRQCCEFDGQAKGVPLTFPETCFTPLMAQAMLAPGFPLGPMAIIHMYQRVTQHEPLEPGQSYDACCELAEMRTTERGVECDFEMRLTRAGELFWSGMGTMLSRSRRKLKGSTRRNGGNDHAVATVPSITVDVPSDTGRRYARASGDYNPIHLWKRTAMPMGFKRPIAHGMWTFSRVLGMALASTDADQNVSAEAYFKRPLLMPGTVRLSADTLNTELLTTSLAVQNPETEMPHLVGQVGIPDFPKS